MYRWLILQITDRESWREYRKTLLAQMSLYKFAMDIHWSILQNETDKHIAIDLMAEYMDDYKKYHDCERQYKMTNFSKYIYL